MNTPPSGVDIFHEIERAMIRSSNRQVAQLVQSSRVLDFLDTQRHKIERGEWSTGAYYLDRLRLSWSPQWRGAPPLARSQVRECLANVGVRVVHAEQMKGWWAQLQEVDTHLGIGDTFKKAAGFASRLTARRHEDTVDHSAPARPSPRS